MSSSAVHPQRIAFLGTGKIGEALLSGLLRAGKRPADVLVTARRPERAAELSERYGVTACSNQEAAKLADTLILAVKPQDMGALMDELASEPAPGGWSSRPRPASRPAGSRPGCRRAPRWSG